MSCETPPFDVQSWDYVYSLDILSNECASAIRSLLSCPTSITVARGFQGDEAQRFIDFLDQALELPLCLDKKLRKRCLRLLSKICKAHGIIPTSYMVQWELIRVGRVRCYGGSAEVSDGEYLGSLVAVKQLKLNEGNLNRVSKVRTLGQPRGFPVLRMYPAFMSRDHLLETFVSSNILPLLGASVSTDPYCLYILSEWMPNGNVMQYTRSNPRANRLQLLLEVMAGVTYLHNLDIVHGDLKGANILVDNTGIARVADFGLATMTDLSAVLFSVTSVSSVGTFRWMSPELLEPSRFGCSGRPTREADSYALGMVIYEVLTGLQPFHRLRGYTPVPAILRGDRPVKPHGAESLGFSHGLWELTQSCWSESVSTRPIAQRLLDCLLPASRTWDPPSTYPTTGIDDECISESDSAGTLPSDLGCWD